jgi:hypothetical protein
VGGRQLVHATHGSRKKATTRQETRMNLRVVAWSLIPFLGYTALDAVYVCIYDLGAGLLNR